jgi:hypothetical protein
MATKRHDRLAKVFKEIEGLAKRLRGDVRIAARKAGLTKQIEKAASTLRRRAVDAATLVEKYAHELRMELAKPRNPVRKRARKPARRARAA